MGFQVNIPMSCEDPKVPNRKLRKKVCQNNVKMMHYLSMTKAFEKNMLWKKKAYLKKVFFEMHLKSMLDIFPVLISMYCKNTSLLWFISFIRLLWNSSLYQTSLASSKVFRDYVVCNKTSILKAVSLKSDIKFQIISFKNSRINSCNFISENDLGQGKTNNTWWS